MGWFGSKQLSSLTHKTQPTTYFIENPDTGETSTIQSTGKAIKDSSADQTLEMGLTELSSLINRGPYTDPQGRFRLAPNPDRFRLVIYVTSPYDTNLAAAKSWLSANKFSHIPDFKIDVVQSNSLWPLTQLS